MPGYHDYEGDIGQVEILQLESNQKYSASLPNYYKHYGEEMYHQFTYEIGVENRMN